MATMSEQIDELRAVVGDLYEEIAKIKQVQEAKTDEELHAAMAALREGVEERREQKKQEIKCDARAYADYHSQGGSDF